MASFKKALMAGVAGTVVMTVFSFMSHYLNLPKSDLHEMIASHLPMGDLVSWVIYFGFGVGLAYVYGDHVRMRLPYHSYIRGMIYAAILWGVMGMILMPLMGMGFFSGSIATAVTALIGMGLYGATVGYLYEH